MNAGPSIRFRKSAFRFSRQLRQGVAALACGFTRTDMMAALATLSLLAAVALPALANTKPRSQRVICFNNLRQIGRAFQLWANDHDDKNPYELYPSEGGTRGSILAPVAWYEFAWISNELVTPKILVCPADKVKWPADNFSDRAGHIKELPRPPTWWLED